MATTPAEPLQTLGRSQVRVPAMGLGTWAWGDRLFWSYGRSHDDEDIRGAFEAASRVGVTFFDTAETYGRGRSERLLGRLLSSTDASAVVATKFFPYPWRVVPDQLQAALRASLRRLQLRRVDLYQIHWPYSLRGVEVWAQALAAAAEAGRARAVGVSNYNARQMQRTVETLRPTGVHLAANQVPYSLLNRSVERNGTMNACRDHEVTLIAYSPLGQGLLTGKYTPENPPPGVRRFMGGRRRLESLGPLLAAMKRIGEGHGGRSLAQVAINWTIAKGALPIPGVKNRRQTEDNLGALGWRLSGDEVAELDRLSSDLG